MSAMEQDDINIRPFEQRDIDDVVLIYNKIREEKIPGIKRSRLTYRGILTHEQIAATEPGNPLDFSLVAEINGQITGFVWAQLAYVGIPIDEVILINTLFVDPDYQKRGIAKRLIYTLVDNCQTTGLKTIRAMLDERHWELRNYFQGLGFHRSQLAMYIKTCES